MAEHRDDKAAFIGVGGLAAAGFLYAYSAIATPGWLTSLAMPLLWLVLLVLGCRWFGGHPRRVVVVSVLALMAWFAVALLDPR